MAGPISEFIKKHFKHFNAATLVAAAEAYKKFVENGGKMMLTLAGAMSTAELGISLAEMIRQDKVHAITCTGANLEEDIYNLIAHKHYKQVPHYRYLTPDDEERLYEEGFSRVTDTCIPEKEAMERLDRLVFGIWRRYDRENAQCLPHEPIYELINSGQLEKYYETDPKHSWVVAAAQKNLPLFVPGWEDSTLGNMFAAHTINGELRPDIIKSGLHYMRELVGWYKRECVSHKLGFFQIGGGIAGDFSICVVPLILKDLKEKVPYWSYFCQISDSTTSYGSYSGAVPNEKITWGKLDKHSEKFIIESDATIVAPLIFAYVLGW
ncbi:MAG: deoxyhypusine synthase family protein [Candidatus Micrarchaeia archaeon]